jgi:2-keto-3-deoxy-L-fuconate dehydrogenase
VKLVVKKRLEGKRALITAAANGIGRATAMAFAREGAQVIAVDIDKRELRTLVAKHARIRGRLLDVTNADAVARLGAANDFDVVFNCAGWVHQGTVEDCDEEAWRRSFSMNIDSMYRICRAVIPRMVRGGGGSIINMSSVVSSIKGAAQRFAYGASKAAVIGLTKSIAADYVKHNIRCNAVCPGTVRTPSLETRVASLVDAEHGAEEVWRGFIDRQPLGRLGEAEEIAALVVYLASDESAFTTGGAFVIDGGWSN